MFHVSGPFFSYLLIRFTWLYKALDVLHKLSQKNVKRDLNCSFVGENIFFFSIKFHNSVHVKRLPCFRSYIENLPVESFSHTSNHTIIFNAPCAPPAIELEQRPLLVHLVDFFILITVNISSFFLINKH